MSRNIKNLLYDFTFSDQIVYRLGGQAGGICIVIPDFAAVYIP